MRIFFFSLIIFSGLQISGYAVIDVLFIGAFLALTAISKKSSLKIKVNWVLIFCIYMILQVFRGMYILGDFRMMYWVIFFIVVYFSHIYLVGLAKKSKLGLQFAKMIFNYCLVYFLIYGILAIFIRDVDSFQGIYWVGSSAAFILVIPFLVSHFVLFQASGFSLSALKFPSLMAYLIVTVVHYSRMGMYLLFFYLIYLAFKTLTFSPKKFIFISSAFLISLFIWDSTRFAFYVNPDATGLTEISQASSFVDSETDLQETSNDVARFLMIVSAYDKSISSPQEFLFGSGWYTSRYTLKPFEEKVFDRFGLLAIHVSNDKPMQITSFAAIVSDTGIIGLLFMLYFFFKSASQIIKANPDGKVIILGFLFLNWLFYIVGFAFISIISYLLIFPNGLLVSLARANNTPNQVIK